VLLAAKTVFLFQYKLDGRSAKVRGGCSTFSTNYDTIYFLSAIAHKVFFVNLFLCPQALRQIFTVKKIICMVFFSDPQLPVIGLSETVDQGEVKRNVKIS
jgi:hypothetical protein